jgi:hypothetical protein
MSVHFKDEAAWTIHFDSFLSSVLLGMAIYTHLRYTGASSKHEQHQT